MKEKQTVVCIGMYPFKVQFVDYEELNGCDGKTFINGRTIKIRNDLDGIDTELVLRHEVVHAILDTQGRCYQKKFDLEEVCEFIAYKLPEINNVVDTILRQLNNKENKDE